MSGPITFRAHVVVPPENEKFLRKLQLDGDFSITRAHLNKARTQVKINELSARARSDSKAEELDEEGRPESVLTNLKGHVRVRDGIAYLSNVSFRLPGAIGTGGGTFNLLTKRIALEGKVAMEADVSEAAGGVKGFLLKPFNFLFRRKDRKEGAVLPVRMTGVYPRPQFRVLLRPN